MKVWNMEEGLPAQYMLSVILILVDALQVSWATMGRATCCSKVGKAALPDVQVSYKFPQPVTRPLYPASSRLQEKKWVTHGDAPSQELA